MNDLQTELDKNQEKIFKNYRIGLGITGGLSAINDTANLLIAINDERRNRNAPRPDNIKRLKYSPVSPLLQTAGPEQREVDKGFISGLNLARQLGRADVIPGLIANRQDSLRKLNTDVGRNNLASYMESARTNIQGRQAVDQTNLQIDDANIRRQMEFDNYISQAIATNKKMQTQSMAGLVDTGARAMENFTSASVFENMLKQGKLNEENLVNSQFANIFGLSTAQLNRLFNSQNTENVDDSEIERYDIPEMAKIESPEIAKRVAPEIAKRVAPEIAKRVAPEIANVNEYNDVNMQFEPPELPKDSNEPTKKYYSDFSKLDIESETFNKFKQFEGSKYEFGKTDTSNLDCSGAICKMFNIPRDTSENIYQNYTTDKKQLNDINDIDNLEDGEIIFLDTGNYGWDDDREYGIDHVAVIIVDKKTGQKYVADVSERKNQSASAIIMDLDEYKKLYNNNIINIYKGKAKT
jgi:cell wall-associated NlpC family hydrolase